MNYCSKSERNVQKKCLNLCEKYSNWLSIMCIYLLTLTFTNSDYRVANKQCDDWIVTYLSDDDRNSLIILLIRALLFTVRKPLQQRVWVQFCSASVVQVGDCSFLFDSKVFTAGNHEAVKWNTQPTAAEETLWASQRLYAHICIQIHMMKSGLGLLPGAETALYRAL